MNEKNDLVSIIITNWNGKRFLAGCIDSVLGQTYQKIEIIVVDCASNDGSLELLKDRYGREPRVKTISFKTDPGVSAACNIACREHAKGEYVLLLNNDVVLPSDCIFKMLEGLGGDNETVVNPLQLNFKGQFVPWTFHEPWISPFLHKVRKIFLRHLQGNSVFYPSLACCLMKKQVLIDVPLNEHLFYQDVEWGWRLYLNKIRIKVLFDSYFFHADAGTVKGTEKQAYIYGVVAMATTYICLSMSFFLLFLPVILSGYLVKFIRYLFSMQFKLASAYFRGFIQFFKDLRYFNIERRQVQSERKIGDLEVIRFMLQSMAYSKILEKKGRAFAATHFIQRLPEGKP